MLSPNLAQLNRDAFVLDEALESTVRLDEHRGDSALDDPDLGDSAELASRKRLQPAPASRFSAAAWEGRPRR